MLFHKISCNYMLLRAITYIFVALKARFLAARFLSQYGHQDQSSQLRSIQYMQFTCSLCAIYMQCIQFVEFICSLHAVHSICSICVQFMQYCSFVTTCNIMPSCYYVSLCASSCNYMQLCAMHVISCNIM